MEEIRRNKIQNAAHHIALECIHPQDGLAYSTPSDSPILGRALCLTPRGSPVPGRVTHLSDKFSDSLTLNSDTEILVAKIGAMFPTVSETHIKILLKKYHNREAVVISALQVEKHPIATPGPLSMSPSSVRLQKGSTSQLCKASSIHDSTHLTPLSGTPQGSPSLLRPSSGASSYFGTTRSTDGISTRPQSPKMKLKYLKSLYQKAEETLILDVLASKDNNVQKASEELQSMGFAKKDTISNPPPKKKEGYKPPKKTVTILKTAEDKEKVKRTFKSKYSSIAERVVSIALESVDYCEERADQILSAVLQENSAKSNIVTTTSPKPRVTEPPKRALEGGAPEPRQAGREAPAQPPAARRIKAWTDHLKPILKPNSSQFKYKTAHPTQAVGPNPTLCQGPKDNLLLDEYMTWKGPNPDIRQGSTTTPVGPATKLKVSIPIALGPSPARAKGPAGIAKGSVYQKIKKITSFH